MRWSPVFVVLALAASACFAELPDVPGGSSSSGGEASTSTGALGATTMSPTDADSVDAPSTGGLDPTTGEPPESEGLFACDATLPCAAWTLPTCPGVCSLDAAGTCVLQRLRDQVQGPLRVRQCDGGCSLDALLLRGAGTPTLRRQRATLGPNDELTDYQAPVRCELRATEFFAGCLEAFSAECADPEAWVSDCGPTDVLACQDPGGA